MKTILIKSGVFILILLLPLLTTAQCAMCTKTASQLGEKPAIGLNNAIIYLMMAPLIIIGVIAYRWWRGQAAAERESESAS